MIIGERILERLGVIGISQAELARRVGVRQPTINGLIRGPGRQSPHVHVIARELRTSPAYLTGETDDPDENAPTPPAPPTYQAITLQVLLPGEPALARMFEGLLRTMDRSTPLEEQARLLAQRLPIGLSQLRDLMPTTAAPASTRRRQPTRVPEPQS